MKRKPEATLNDLEAYIGSLGEEPLRLIERELKSWGELSYEELITLIDQGRLNDFPDWQEKYSELINDVLSPLWMGAAIEAARRATKNKIILSDSMDDVKAWLRSHGGELIAEMSSDSRRAISNILLLWQERLMNPRIMAQQIRPLIGLTARQMAAADNYRSRVYSSYLEAGAKASTAKARADAAAIKYANKMHRQRAETILQTELSFAYNRGADIGVKRAIAQGLMPKCYLRWRTAGTNRVCGRCLELKDKVIGTTDEQGATLPPLHPRCRCTIEYKEIELPKGVPAWRRQEHFFTSEENLRATNPNYNLGVAFQINCQKCVPTYEMRMRGYEVIARPTYDLATDGFAQEHWSAAFENPKIERGFSDTGKENVIERMKAFGSGARGEVYVEWKEGSSHVFIAENRNGEIFFLDPQTGEADVEYYFEQVKAG